jgi:hypothetical protein
MVGAISDFSIWASPQTGRILEPALELVVLGADKVEINHDKEMLLF